MFGGEARCVGSGRVRPPAYPARTASSRHRAGPAAGNGGRAGGRRSRCRRGWSGPAPRCGRLWRGMRARVVAEGRRGRPNRAAVRPGADRRATRFSGRAAAGRPLEGSGGAAASGASRSGGSFEPISRAIGRASVPSCSRIDEAAPGRARGVDEGVGPGSRRQHQRRRCAPGTARPVARRAPSPGRHDFRF